MISSCEINNFGPLENINWTNVARINLIIGKNACGKTFLLKILYSAIRTIEEYGRGNDPRNISDVLSEKLYWTFQVNRLSDLVRKGSENLSLCIKDGDNKFSYQFGASTEKRIQNIEYGWLARNANSLFIPAKEILSLFHIVKKSRDIDRLFGFDDTYLDLVRAIEIDPIKGKNYEQFSLSRKKLETMLNGKIAFENNEWVYKEGNSRFPIHTASEGVKKFAIFDRVLGNRYLSPESIVFIDEPEAALHPSALIDFLDIVAMLSSVGMQFFIASHSYFVIKKLVLLAREKQIAMTTLSFEEDRINFFDLRHGMPDNPIIDESIDLYEQDVEISLR